MEGVDLRFTFITLFCYEVGSTPAEKNPAARRRIGTEWERRVRKNNVRTALVHAFGR